ncbi:MAG: hypothetical protein ABI778_12385 [Ignavibacteriota bacterium]
MKLWSGTDSWITMLELHQTITVPQDHILHLNVPEVPKGEEVEVYIYTKKGEKSRAEKLALIAKAANDPLYLQDIEEIENDFSGTLGDNL